jgi:hypothetical protein
MEKYGFVYIWYDCGKSKQQDAYRKFYIGGHWGYENDSYVCSSTWMRDARKKRPQDFKRRILSRHSDQEELWNAEYKWLQLIKDEELGNRYYNKHKTHQDIPWNKGKTGILTQADKDRLAEARRNSLVGTGAKKGNVQTAESNQKRSKTLKDKYDHGYVSPSLGKRFKRGPMSEEHKLKVSSSKKGKPWSESRRLAQVNK